MGGLKKLPKTEGGSGGKRGHSNMAHWEFTEEIKEAARTQRRLQGKRASRDAGIAFREPPPASKDR